MPLLEAFLALALTMLSLAMIASLVVEAVHRLLKTRAKDLTKMIEGLYDRELKTLVENRFKDCQKIFEENQQEFVARMILNPLADAKDTTELDESLKNDNSPWWAIWKWTWNWRSRLEHLSIEDFFKRLAETEIGKQIKQKTEEEIDEFVDSLAVSYDSIEVAATDVFSRNARGISFVAGLLVAFGLNVNAILIFEMYMDDPVARAKAVAQADAVAAKFEEQVKNSEDAENGFENLEQAEELAAAIRNDVDSLKTLGVTIGWIREKPPLTLWRASMRQDPENQAGHLNSETFMRMVATWEFWKWLLGVTGTGLLIGLGGPFWFDVVKKLSTVVRAVRGEAPPPAEEAADAAPAPARDSTKPLKDVFKKAGGLPDSVKAKQQLKAANEVVSSSAETLERLKEAEQQNPAIQAAREEAEQTLHKNSVMLAELQAKTDETRRQAIAATLAPDPQTNNNARQSTTTTDQTEEE